MKTTIELPDALFHSAKALAANSQTTLRALIEEGLRHVLNESHKSAKPAFKLADASIHGGKMLIENPRDWQTLEDEHLTQNLR